MSIISVKSASKAVTIAASVLCLGGIISFVRADETQRPIALNVIIGASAIAFSSHVSAQLCEESAKYQAGKLVEKHEIQVKGVEKERDAFNEKYRKQTNVVTEVKAINAKKEQENFVLGEELKIKNALIVALQKQLEEIKSTITQRYAEIDEKLVQEDKRYELAIYQLKTSFQESLKYKIDTSYEKLADSITYRLTDKRLEGIFPQLEKLYTNLKQAHPKHYELLNEIAYVSGDGSEVVEAITDIYFQISDEISAFKVRYRNTLNIDERVALEVAMDELIERRDRSKFIPKPKVDKAIDFYKDSQEKELLKIQEIARQNSQNLQALKDEVYELISQLEVKNMEIAGLKQKIAKLSEPYQFFGKGTLAEIGNLVISHYYRNYGYVLDGLSWKEHDTGYEITFGTRRNPALTEEQVYQNNSQIQLAAITNSLHGTLPKFDFNRQDSTAVLSVTLRNAPKKVAATPEESAKEFKLQLKPSESLIDFVNSSYHIGMWGETGRGKSTAISNTIGGLIQALGASPTIRSTIPKIDEDTREMFPHIDWLGVPNSVFGLLEAALEIQFRIHKNEEAYLNGEEFQEFEPILFFIDEINMIFSRWGKVNDADLDNVLKRFEETLNGERLEYFQEYMTIELRNYKNEFAKRLLLFIWQTGRSLKVKSLIAGQNLQPGAFRMMANDIANCSYLAFGNSKHKCLEYKGKSSEVDTIKVQLNEIENLEKTDKQLQFTGLFCPSVGNSFLAILPAPNTYQWDKALLVQKRPNSLDNLDAQKALERLSSEGWTEFGQGLDKSPSSLDNGQKNVQTRPTVERLSANGFERFVQDSKLSKQYQKLDYEGCVQLWGKLPKKPDGSVHKTKAYEQVFGVSRSSERKVYSDFIDYLEKLCR